MVSVGKMPPSNEAASQRTSAVIVRDAVGFTKQPETEGMRQRPPHCEDHTSTTQAAQVIFCLACKAVKIGLLVDAAADTRRSVANAAIASRILRFRNINTRPALQV